ncbi:nitroreductase family protein [Lacticaseibacillus nasuensis]|nr:nitroreductase family protein [Lacticaseibacillus nasuensis]
METMATIRSRHAIRQYTGAAPSPAAMAQIETALQAAPVAMGAYDHLHATIITDPAILKAIDDTAARQFGRANMLYGAPVFILLSAKPAHETLGNADYASAGIVVHNMALAATAAGVGCCYIWGAVAALNQEPATVAKLNLPAGFVPCCGLVLGEFAGDYAPREIPSDRIGINRLA